MQKVHRSRTAHDRISDPGDHIGPDPVLDAVFDDDIAVMAVNTA